MSFFIKQNDTVPSLRATLKNGSGSAIDLTNATVRFHMRSLAGTSAKVDASAAIVTANTGIVQYNWVGADTNTIGSYQGEFEVTYQDGTIETFPNNNYLHIEVLDDLA